MKVLFTGMASSHCARTENVSFFTTLADAVSVFAEVVWASPKLSWTIADLESYDAIYFGMTPPTALSANKIYGAMHVLNLMFDSPKLNIVVDSPQMWQYKNSIESVKRDINTLFSPFYAKRPDYVKAQKTEYLGSILSATQKMSSNEWPTIIYPSLPWSSDSKVLEILGLPANTKIQGLNLDSLLLSQEVYDLDRPENWAVENPKSGWYKNLTSTLRLPALSTKRKRASSDSDALEAIKNSFGLIVPPQDRKTGTWWSYRYIQALNTGTPIVTHWQDVHAFDQSWSVLAYQVEDLTQAGRRALARDQYEAYSATLVPRMQLINDIRVKMIESVEERI